MSPTQTGFAMSDLSQPPKPPPSKPVIGNDKSDRLAAALRDNLKRRKAAERARRERGADDPEPPTDE
jgi:hypothetical protein